MAYLKGKFELRRYYLVREINLLQLGNRILEKIFKPDHFPILMRVTLEPESIEN
jgi:hypothetical protein